MCVRRARVDVISDGWFVLIDYRFIVNSVRSCKVSEDTGNQPRGHLRTLRTSKFINELERTRFISTWQL
ncbi:Hypothetical predicted protein [Cloeon dipterum]|uniref:Uncharacterized protein n=1 Tax=Cloeon dipterum TaxID=197152 RepID=A0A8S1D1F4_9INSE|nr:Hypothetical predicted protein [Cloeon dipterum]